MPSRPKQPAEIPARFEPKFWDLADSRQRAVKLIRQRYDLLSADIGVDSVQKRLLCERAVFISVQLETMEVEASEGKEFKSGLYANLSNTLMGLLKTLGLERNKLDGNWFDELGGDK